MNIDVYTELLSNWNFDVLTEVFEQRTIVSNGIYTVREIFNTAGLSNIIIIIIYFTCSPLPLCLYTKGTEKIMIIF